MDTTKQLFYDAVIEVWGLLSPLNEREEPQILGDRTSQYVSEDVWSAASKAHDAGRAVLNNVDPSTERDWLHLYHLSVITRELTGGMDEGSALEPLQSLFFLLDEGQAAAFMAERDENTCRKDMAPSEKVAIGRALEELEIPKAMDRRAATLKKAAEHPRSGNLPEGEKVGHGDVRDLAGSAEASEQDGGTTMSDRITQEEIDREVKDHLGTIMPLLKRLVTGVGYVELVGVDDQLTAMGLSMVPVARTVAWDSATYLYEDVLGAARPSLNTMLLADVQKFLAVTASALDGMDAEGAPPGVGPVWIAHCLWVLGRDLRERAEEAPHV